MKTYYEWLEVGPQASLDEIKKAYKRLAKQHHPDANAGSKQSEMIFKQVSEAYQTLSNASTRAAYDERLKAKQDEKARPNPTAASPMNGNKSRQPQPPMNMDATKAFEAFFGIKRK